MKKLLTTLSILLIATASYTYSEASTVKLTVVEALVVERVIDGNTIVGTTTKGKSERVRLIGIDTPESEPNDKAKRDSKRTGQDVETINKMGEEATEFVNDLMELCPENKVIIEFDIDRRDKYGRLLAYVFCEKQYGGLGVTVFSSKYKLFSSKYKLGDRALNGLHYELMEGLFLNATIIKAGYATPMTIPPNVKYADLFKVLYEEAREQKRGLWSEESDLLLMDFNSKPEKIAITMH